MPCNSRVCDKLVQSLKLLGRHINAATSGAHVELSALIGDDSQICQNTDSSEAPTAGRAPEAKPGANADPDRAAGGRAYVAISLVPAGRRRASAFVA